MTFPQLVVIILCLVALAYSQYRIIGGRITHIEEVPYQLSLRQDGIYICGAVLIANKYALSAAHCVKVVGMYSVRAGSNTHDKGGILTDVKTAILHPEHVNSPYDYDIAILELTAPISISSKIRPVRLPENAELLRPGIKGIISGYGSIFNGDYDNTILRAAVVSVEDKTQCGLNYKLYGVTLSPRQFCAGVHQGNKDSCQGDSGGPFVIDGVLYGLVSFGMNCGESQYPGIYTSVPEFREFIRLNTGI